jgi:hypothetical protein
MPGCDVDYALCIERDGDKALLRFQVYQQDGPWNEAWVDVCSEETPRGCWATNRLGQIGPALIGLQREMFPNAAPSPSD